VDVFLEEPFPKDDCFVGVDLLLEHSIGALHEFDSAVSVPIINNRLPLESFVLQKQL